MLSPTTYRIRLATPDDDQALRGLAELDSQAPLTAGPVLLGEIDGKPEAALSLADGRVIANPLLSTGQLLAHLRARAAALGALERMPSLTTRIRVALSGAVLARPAGASA
jgi:hypothetical protein